MEASQWSKWACKEVGRDMWPVELEATQLCVCVCVCAHPLVDHQEVKLEAALPRSFSSACHS